MTTATLTPARRRALEVMAATRRPARVSNSTSTVKSVGVALVYWQVADWLIDQGLARATDAGGLVLTAAGVAAAKAED